MALIDNFADFFGKTSTVERQKMGSGERLTIVRLNYRVHVDFYTNGNVRACGRNCGLKASVDALIVALHEDERLFEKPEELARITRADITLKKLVSPELYAYFPDHDRDAMEAALEILGSQLELPDYSPVKMPIARAYEGFLARLYVSLGISTAEEVRSKDFKFTDPGKLDTGKKLYAKVPTHEAKMKGAHQRLQEFRHIQLHSQASEFVQSKSREEARKFVESVLANTQDYFDYFKKYFIC